MILIAVLGVAYVAGHTVISAMSTKRRKRRTR